MDSRRRGRGSRPAQAGAEEVQREVVMPMGYIPVHIYTCICSVDLFRFLKKGSPDSAPGSLCSPRSASQQQAPLAVTATRPSRADRAAATAEHSTPAAFSRRSRSMDAPAAAAAHESALYKSAVTAAGVAGKALSGDNIDNNSNDHDDEDGSKRRHAAAIISVTVVEAEIPSGGTPPVSTYRKTSSVPPRTRVRERKEAERRAGAVGHQMNNNWAVPSEGRGETGRL